MLDAGSAAFLEAGREKANPPLAAQTPNDFRATVRAGSLALAPPAEPMHAVEDRQIPGPGGELAVRVYTPRHLDIGERLPLVVHYHGAGWVGGDLETHDAIARYYAKHADAIVIAVDYRLAPEHPFPAAVDDAYAAAVWAAEHADQISGSSARLAVTGDSAGGNLAAVVCQLARERGVPRIAYQALVYPVTDLDPNASYPSRDAFGGGDYFLSTADMAWFREQYLTDPASQGRDPRASPLVNPDLRGLPPALVITAGHDPLRDEGKAYADGLAAAGVPVEYRCFEGTIHAFVSFTGMIPTGLEALAFVASRMRAALA